MLCSLAIHRWGIISKCSQTSRTLRPRLNAARLLPFLILLHEFLPPFRARTLIQARPLAKDRGNAPVDLNLKRFKRELLATHAEIAAVFVVRPLLRLRVRGMFAVLGYNTERADFAHIDLRHVEEV